MRSLAVTILDLLPYVQAFVAVVVVLVWAFLIVTGKPITQEFLSVLWFVLGFFFTGSTKLLSNRLREK